MAVLTALSLSGCSVVTSALTPDEREKQVEADRGWLFKDGKPLEGPLTLHEAMARALKYNLDYRLKRMEEVVARQQAEVARLDMLPRWTLAAGYSARTPENASVSRSLSTGIVETDPSISREKATGTADFTMSWNLLDFGVSYYQARQEGNKRLIQGEQRRKAAHNLLKDVRFAYWRAVAAQGLEREVAAVLKSADEALATARQVEQEKLRSPVHSLQYQLGLLEIVNQLERARAELTVAREELATLIHLPPGERFELVDDGSSGAEPLALAAPIDELERQALTQRPELRVEAYQARIEADETRKAIARLFPGLEFDVGENFDGSRYLLYQHWAQAGARLSWNLLRALNGGQQLDLADSREKVIQMRRLVMHMAILGQTRIAYHEYLAARDGLKRVQEENTTRARLRDHAANRGEMGLDSQLSYVHAVASGVLGRVRQYESFARFQSALGRLYATLGWDPLDELGGDLELVRLTRLLRVHDAEWQKRLFAQGDDTAIRDALTEKPLPWRASGSQTAQKDGARGAISTETNKTPPPSVSWGPAGSGEEPVAFETTPLPFVKPLARMVRPTLSSWSERASPDTSAPVGTNPAPGWSERASPDTSAPAGANPASSRLDTSAPAGANPASSRLDTSAPVRWDQAPVVLSFDRKGGAMSLAESKAEVGEPSPVTVAAPAPRPPLPTPSVVKPESKVRYAVQVASGANSAALDSLIERLRAKGYSLRIHETRDAEGVSVKQVWIGVFERHADAKAARDRYQQREQQVGFVRVIQEREG
ncbi:TolC family protein [Candidatus Magnetaquiglobus chichijimensis]|uniref:TolC family protein n=1 Tax=Candidatus Magnetaquiglobus chichijimensis TaxID=3141448 RepID=UPI003B97CAF5